MFVSTPNNQVIAIDVRTGNLLWRYKRPRPAGAIVAHDTSRGVALYGDKVYFAAGEAVLVALDAKTGKEVWTTPVADNKVGLLHFARPADCRRQGDGGRIRRRVRHSRFRRRLRSRNRQGAVALPTPSPRPASPAAKPGRRAATSGRPAAARSGSPATTIPQPISLTGAPATAAPGWAISAPATTSTPPPPSPSTSPPAQIKGHFQYNPNESWDWDEVSPPILVDFQRNGRTFKGLIDVARDGYMWFLDRGDATTGGRIKFIEGKPFVYQNVYKSLDPETGRPECRPRAQARHGQDTPTSAPAFTAARTGPRSPSVRRRA